MRELRRELDLSSNNTVALALDGLETRGWIQRLRYRARAIKVLAPVELPADDVVFVLGEGAGRC